jgi:dihydrofolate reductase
MRLVISDFMSLDGVVQAPGGPDEDRDGGFEHGGWSMPYFDDASMGPVIDAGLTASEALLFGRRTWQSMASAWPERAGDAFADRMNSITKYVVSRTLEQTNLAWDNSLLVRKDDPIAAVRELRERQGGDLLVMGSASLARSLFEARLVDELRLMIEPVLLGGGKRIFASDSRFVALELMSATTTETGVLICSYRPVERDGT